MSWADAGETMAELTDEYNCGRVEGIVVKSAIRPHVQVQAWTRVYTWTKRVVMPSTRECRADQTDIVRYAAAKEIRDGLPTALRGQVHVPTWEELKQRSANVAAAMGFGNGGWLTNSGNPTSGRATSSRANYIWTKYSWRWPVGHR